MRLAWVQSLSARRSPERRRRLAKVRQVQLRARRSGGSRNERICGRGGDDSQRCELLGACKGGAGREVTHGEDELEGEREEAEPLEGWTRAARLVLLLLRLLDRLLMLLNRLHCAQEGLVSSVPWCEAGREMRTHRGREERGHAGRARRR